MVVLSVFFVATIVLSIIVGSLLGVLLRALEPNKPSNSENPVLPSDSDANSFGSWLAGVLFHGLGGQDSRDAFDFVFERENARRHDFHRHCQGVPDHKNRQRPPAGIYPDAIRIRPEPEPHDLLLEETWEIRGEGTLKRIVPRHEAWFPATEIKDLWFRAIENDELEKGLITDLRVSRFEGLRIPKPKLEADAAKRIFHESEPLVGNTSREDLNYGIVELAEKMAANSREGATYEVFLELRRPILFLGAKALAFAREVEPEPSDTRIRADQFEDEVDRRETFIPSFEAWFATLEWYESSIPDDPIAASRHLEQMAASVCAVGLVTVEQADAMDWPEVAEWAENHEMMQQR